MFLPEHVWAQAEKSKNMQLDRYGDPLPAGALMRFGTVRWRLPETVVALAYSSDGKSLITVSESIRVWDVASGKVLRKMGVFDGYVRCAAVSADRSFIAVGDREGAGGSCISLWDIGKGREIVRLRDKENDPISGILASLAIAPDGRTLAARYFMSTAVKVWEIVGARETRFLGKHHEYKGWEGSIQINRHNLAFSPDGKYLVAASEDQESCRWEIASGKRLLLRKKDSVSGLAIAPDGTKLALIREDGVHLEDFSTGNKLGAFKGSNLQWARPTHVTFSHDGKLLAASEYVGSVGIWDGATRKRITETSEQPLGYDCCSAFSPDGKTVAAAIYPSIRLWDVATGKEIGPDRGHAHEVLAAALSPDGKTLLSKGSGSIRVWETATRMNRYRLATQPARFGRIIFSPDGKRFAALGEDMLSVWEAATGKCRVRFHPFFGADVTRAVGLLGSIAGTGPLQTHSFLYVEPYTAPEPLAFSVDGKLLVASDRAENLFFFDVSTGTEVRRSWSRNDRGQILCRSADGKMVALRELRSVEILEQIGSDQATKILTRLAAGAPAARLTRDAASALERLQYRYKGSDKNDGPITR